MVLIDTTVWIDFLKDRPTPEVQLLDKVLQDEGDIFTTGLILQEVLSGIKKRNEREAVKSDFRQFIPIMPTLGTHVQAAEIFDSCQKKGFTVRSTIDCLIAALAIEYDLPLLQSDRDFDFIAKATPLKLFGT